MSFLRGIWVTQLYVCHTYLWKNKSKVISYFYMYVYLHKWWSYYLWSEADLLRIKGIAINNYTMTTGIYNHSTYTPIYLYYSQTSISTPRRFIHASITINSLHIYHLVFIKNLNLDMLWMCIKGVHMKRQAFLCPPFPPSVVVLELNYASHTSESQAWDLYTMVLWSRSLMAHIIYMNLFLNLLFLFVCMRERWYLVYSKSVI